MTAKALFLDLDGTLLNDDRQITPGNRAAIEKALAAGHKVIITSGRPLVATVPLSDALGLNKPGCYVIAYNGCVFYDSYRRETIFRSVLPLPLVCELFAEANRRGIHIQTYDEEKVLVEPRCAGSAVTRYCGPTRMEWDIIPDIRTLTREPEKILVIDFNDRKPLDDFREHIRENYGDIVDTFYSNAYYMEIINKGINKGEAILRLADLIGIDRKDTIAAGDAENDATMIQSAHIGAAMANASSEVKAIADYVTSRDNNHDGIAELIERYILTD